MAAHTMEQAEPRVKDYEVGYILSPSIPEEEVLMYAGKITGLIEESKGTIKHVEEPKKKRLAYPVKKERNAYFGWTTFRTETESVKTLDKKLRMHDGILRHLILEEDISKKPPIFRTPHAKAPAGHALSQQPTAREADSEERLDLEALDKKLEEILGK